MILKWVAEIPSLDASTDPLPGGFREIRHCNHSREGQDSQDWDGEAFACWNCRIRIRGKSGGLLTARVNLDSIAKPLGLLNPVKREWGTTVRLHLKLNKQTNQSPPPTKPRNSPDFLKQVLSLCFMLGDPLLGTGLISSSCPFFLEA